MASRLIALIADTTVECGKSLAQPQICL